MKASPRKVKEGTLVASFSHGAKLVLKIAAQSHPRQWMNVEQRVEVGSVVGRKIKAACVMDVVQLPVGDIRC